MQPIYYIQSWYDAMIHLKDQKISPVQVFNELVATL